MRGNSGITLQLLSSQNIHPHVRMCQCMCVCVNMCVCVCGKNNVLVCVEVEGRRLCPGPWNFEVDVDGRY